MVCKGLMTGMTQKMVIVYLVMLLVPMATLFHINVDNEQSDFIKREDSQPENSPDASQSGPDSIIDDLSASSLGEDSQPANSPVDPQPESDATLDDAIASSLGEDSQQLTTDVDSDADVLVLLHDDTSDAAAACVIIACSIDGLACCNGNACRDGTCDQAYLTPEDE